MLREPVAFLWDIVESAEAIEQYVAGKTYEQFLGDQLLRDAVERRLMIAGEAMVQASRQFDDLRQHVTEVPAIIGFRNFLVHHYHGVLEEIVWTAATEDVHKLATEVRAYIKLKDLA